jgi:hypothetical protein
VQTGRVQSSLLPCHLLPRRHPRCRTSSRPRSSASTLFRTLKGGGEE